MQFTLVRDHISQSSLLQAGLVLLVSFLLYVPFVYRCGAGEADSGSMVAGLYQAGLTQDVSSSPLYYFHQGQPLYNLSFAWLVATTRISYDALLTALNLLACISMATAAGALYYFCRQHKIPALSSLAGTLVFLLAPYAFELATYAHPQSMSIALVLVAFCLWKAACQAWPDSRTHSTMYGAAAAATGAAGLLCRMDGIVLVPLLWAFPLLAWHGMKQFIAMAVGFPALISGLALAGRAVIVPQEKADAGHGLLQLLIRFMETSINDGLPRILVAFGSGGVLIVTAYLVLATSRRDFRGLFAALLALLPVVIYTCQNAHVPRRFIHLFVVAGAAVAILSRNILEDGVSRRTPRQMKRSKGKPVRIQAAAAQNQPQFSTQKLALLVAVLITGNWLLWPAYGTVAKTVGNPLPDTMFWNALSHFMPKRHYDQQQYYCWSKKANRELTKTLSAPHDLIGIWLHYGELLAGFSRNRIPVAIVQLPQKEGSPVLKRITANGITHTYYSPPWDFPPGQQSPAVILLEDYGPNVTSGLRNITRIVPPPGLKYHIW